MLEEMMLEYCAREAMKRDQEQDYWIERVDKWATQLARVAAKQFGSQFRAAVTKWQVMAIFDATMAQMVRDTEINQAYKDYLRICAQVDTVRRESAASKQENRILASGRPCVGPMLDIQEERT